MNRCLWTLVALGLVGPLPYARAACHPFGTQVHCALGRGDLVIGTQTAAEPRHAGMPGSLFLGGGSGPIGRRRADGAPFRLELQNVGTDPGLCWRFGDETYCH
jgi:hypothetical protein